MFELNFFISLTVEDGRKSTDKYERWECACLPGIHECPSGSICIGLCVDSTRLCCKKISTYGIFGRTSLGTRMWQIFRKLRLIGMNRTRVYQLHTQVNLTFIYSFLRVYKEVRFTMPCAVGVNVTVVLFHYRIDMWINTRLCTIWHRYVFLCCVYWI